MKMKKEITFLVEGGIEDGSLFWDNHCVDINSIQLEDEEVQIFINANTSQCIGKAKLFKKDNKIFATAQIDEKYHELYPDYFFEKPIDSIKMNNKIIFKNIKIKAISLNDPTESYMKTIKQQLNENNLKNKK